MATGQTVNSSLAVSVISSEAVLCPATTTNTSKGVYRWGVTLAGMTAQQDCEAGPGQLEFHCQQTGQWGVMNHSQCHHTRLVNKMVQLFILKLGCSDVTDKLFRFAYMNNSDFDRVTLVQSARKLLEFTSQAERFTSGMDLVYLSTVLENYLPHLSGNSELAALLVDIAANTLRMPREVVRQVTLNCVAFSEHN